MNTFKRELMINIERLLKEGLQIKEIHNNKFNEIFIILDNGYEFTLILE